MFSAAVRHYWNVPPSRGDVVHSGPGITIVVDPTLPDNRRVSQLVLPHGGDHFALHPQVASALGDVSGTQLFAHELIERLEAAGERFHDWEYVFYLPQEVRTRLAGSAPAHGVRVLEPADAHAFAAFHELCSPADKDEAFVELDHWLAVGFVDEDGGIGCVASVYPWDGSQLADVGILTAPQFRGRGLGAAVVAEASRLTLERGYEPQYRCQLSNAASRATGERAGFELFTRWRAVTGEDPEQAGGAVH